MPIHRPSISHPLALDTYITVLRARQDRLVVEGVATISAASSEPDTYWVHLRGVDRVVERLIFPDYQHDPLRLVNIINRHFAPVPAKPANLPLIPSRGERR
jgi:hypothetical protein